MTDPTTQHQRFLDGVELLGGARAAARAIDVSERQMFRLIKGEAQLHDGFLRDMGKALLAHADRCRALEKRITPAFAGNLYEGQPRETAKRLRHRDD